MNTTRRGLLGSLIACITGIFIPRPATPAVQWEKPDTTEDDDVEDMTEDDQEDSSSSTNWISTYYSH